MWVVNCCHLVKSYPEALAVIKSFLTTGRLLENRKGSI